MRFPGRFACLAGCALALGAAPSVAGTLVIEPTTVSFGSVPVNGLPATSAVTVTNNGSPTTINGTQGFCSEFSVTPLGPLPRVLGIGESMTFQVGYDPTNRGTDGCGITILDSNGVPDGFQMEGTGTAALLNVWQSQLIFGDVVWDSDDADTLTLTIENVGNETITSQQLSAVVVDGEHFSVGTASSLPIAPGGLAFVPVMFDPASVGFKSDVLVLSISNDLPSEPNRTVNVSGKGVAASGVEGEGEGAARGIRYVGPIPTRGSLTIDYVIDRPGRVDVAIFDVTGRIVWHASTFESAAGPRTAMWPAGRNESPRAGVYFVRVALDGRVLGTRRAVVIR